VTMMVEKECRREKFVETRLLPRSARLGPERFGYSCFAMRNLIQHRLLFYDRNNAMLS
jgi:hypothetical protein